LLLIAPWKKKRAGVRHDAIQEGVGRKRHRGVVAQTVKDRRSGDPVGYGAGAPTISPVRFTSRSPFEVQRAAIDRQRLE